MSTTRNWLLDESPTSKLQASLGNSYRMARALMRNPLAVVGAVILLVLVLAAIFAPWIAPQTPLGQDLGARLLPPPQRRIGWAPTSSAAIFSAASSMARGSP